MKNHEQLERELTAATTELAHLRDMMERTGWRKCADEMPEDDGKVLIHQTTGISVGYYGPRGWFDSRGFQAFVTHWFPIPEPPQV